MQEVFLGGSFISSVERDETPKMRLGWRGSQEGARAIHVIGSLSEWGVLFPTMYETKPPRGVVLGGSHKKN